MNRKDGNHTAALSSGDVSAEFEELTKYLDSLEKEYDIHGNDCKITKDHKVIYRHMSGHSDYDRKVPVSDQDLYHIYSATKVITMTSVLKLAEEGKFGLEDEVAKYLPEFTDMKVARNFTIGQWPFSWPGPEDETYNATKAIRIVDLMSMTAGLSYDIEYAAIKQLQVESNNQASTRDVVAAMAKIPLICEPGTHWAYALGHDVLAAVVEVVSGETFGNYLKKHIFKPLGIEDMYFRLEEEQKKRLSAQYAADFVTKEIKPAGNLNRYRLTDNYESGGAGLACSVDAYSTFIDALCNDGIGFNGACILSKESIDLMRKNHLTEQELEDFKKTGKAGYGYGLGVRTLIDKSKAKSPLGEFGWDGAAGAYVVIDPVNRLSIFYAQQVLGFLPAYDVIHPRIRDLTYEALKL